jgi:hypothetical protein
LTWEYQCFTFGTNTRKQPQISNSQPMEYNLTEVEIRRLADTCEDARKIIQGKFPWILPQGEAFDCEAFLRDIFTNAIYKSDREEFPYDGFFGFDADGNFLFHHNLEYDELVVSMEKIWEPLQETNLWTDEETVRFIKSVAKIHIKWPGVPFDENIDVAWICDYEMEDAEVYFRSPLWNERHKKKLN